MKAPTPDEAVRLERGEILHDPDHNRWKINGRPRIWASGKFQIPIKYGLYGFGYISEWNLPKFHRPSECGDKYPYQEAKEKAIADAAAERVRKKAEQKFLKRFIEK